METFPAFVSNNYSAAGRVQFQRFGHDDGVGDTTKLKWGYVSQGSTQLATAGAGEHHSLQPGCRVLVTQIGGPDGSYVIQGGTFGRGGKGTGGGGGIGSNQADGSTSFNDVDKTYRDNPVPLQNPNQQDGVRCKTKPPDGAYHPDTGKPLDMTKNKYPDTVWREV